MNEVGCFGKIPAHGDFVWHSLPADFVTPWDNWLQTKLVELQGELGADWLDIYLRSNIWRFVIRDPDFGSGSWCGVIAPSVDLVGRYFPFTIAVNTARNTSVVSALSKLDQWFAHAEGCLLDALQQAAPLETLLQTTRAMQIPQLGEREPNESSTTDLWSVNDVGKTPWPTAMLEGIVYRQFGQPCVWESVDAEGARKVVLTEGVRNFAELFRSGS